jgi:hypothetical protein
VAAYLKSLFGLVDASVSREERENFRTMGWKGMSRKELDGPYDMVTNDLTFTQKSTESPNNRAVQLMKRIFNNDLGLRIFDIMSHPKNHSNKNPKVLHCWYDAAMKAFVELSHYRDFYDSLKEWIRGDVERFWTIRGSPGIGKSSFLYFLVFWWFHESDSEKWTTETGQVIDTILIQTVSKERDTTDWYVLRKSANLLLIAQGQPYMSEAMACQGSCYSAKSFHVGEAVVVSGFDTAERKVSTYTGGDIEICRPSTLFVFDGTFRAKEHLAKNILVLDSIGSGHNPMGCQKVAYAPLPTKNEVHVIRDQCLKKEKKAEFDAMYKLIGPNIRDLVLMSKTEIETARQYALDSLKLSDLDGESVEMILVSSERSQGGHRRFLFQLHAVIDEQKTGLEKYGQRHLSCATRAACLDICRTLLKSSIRESKKVINILDGMGYGNNAHAGSVAELVFGKFAKKYGIEVDMRSGNSNFVPSGDTEMQVGGDLTWTMCNLVKLGTSVKLGVPKPAAIPQHDGEEIFFVPPPGQDLYDFALLRMKGLDLFQVTIGDSHNMATKALVEVLKKFSSLKIRFFMIKVVTNAEEYEEFRKQETGIGLRFKTSSMRKKFQNATGKFRYHECVWRLYEALDSGHEKDIEQAIATSAKLANDAKEEYDSVTTSERSPPRSRGEQPRNEHGPTEVKSPYPHKG